MDRRCAGYEGGWEDGWDADIGGADADAQVEQM